MAMCGGGFVVRAATPADVLVPEALSHETRLMAHTAADFLRGEVLPAADRIEAKEPGLLPTLLRHAGDLGLLGTAIPSAWDGLGLPESASALIAESLAAEPSYAVSHSVHSTVAALPIIFYGTLQQKQRYLPAMAAGSTIGAFALSESHSASDALAMRTRAARLSDGSYVLGGEKMWVTNAGFADLFVLFALAEEGPTAFLVDRDLPGLTIGREEHKLGIKGSSTCRVTLDGVRVASYGVLGAPGDGGHIALSVLNLGRFRIAANAVGESKHLLGLATRYAASRKAFGQPVASLGLIQEKLGTMAARIYAAESMLYRLAGCLDSAFAGIEGFGPDSPERYRAAASEYSLECALAKVFCTETLGYVADEALQIHGGYGFTEEYPVARAWRDARVTRIYEGTNEVNRLGAARSLLRDMKGGRLPLPKLPGDLMEMRSFLHHRMGNVDSGTEGWRVALQCTVQSAAAAFPSVSEDEEPWAAVADMLMALYAAESALVRGDAAVIAGARSTTVRESAGLLALLDQGLVFRSAAERAMAMCGGVGMLLERDLSAELFVDYAYARDLRRDLAEATVEVGGYPL